MRFLSYLFLALFCLPAACTNKFVPEQHALTSFGLLSQSQARSALLQDDTDGFFDRVTVLEMCIQMRQPLEDSPRDSVLNLFRDFLKGEVMEFVGKESEYVKRMMRKALDLCAALNPALPLPKEIRLVKVASAAYGPSVFYTRENCIVLPQDMLDPRQEERLLKTLVHELFHLLSRYNPELKHRLYAVLGFKPLDAPLVWSDFLRPRLLHNPDAVDMAYGIELKNAQGKPFWAVPVIYSKHGRAQSDLGFFDHLVFQLFEVEKRQEAWHIKAENVGLQPDETQGFFEQIGRNTNYIIHPEEVLADNFQLLVYAKNPAMPLPATPLTEQGKALQAKIEAVLNGGGQ